MIDRLREDAQTLFAEVLALLLDREASRDWSCLSGSFSRKKVKGLEYLYFQYSDPGGKTRQFSLGRDTASLRKLVSAFEKGGRERGGEKEELTRMAGLLRAAGIATTPHGPARVLRALADAGVFAVGGMLMGSYAFQALGNLLGVRWPSASWRTQDVDIAAALSVAVPDLDADVPKALDSLEMGFVPVPRLDPRHASTSFQVRGERLRVDLITPGSDRDREPRFIRRLNASAAPIKHLSLVMRDPQPALVLDGPNVFLVAVPSPARFALHRLFVSRSRAVKDQTKSGKDLHQAALMIEFLAEDRPEDLEEVAADFRSSGPVVVKRLERAMAAARKRFPDSEEGMDQLSQALLG